MHLKGANRAEKRAEICVNQCHYGNKNRKRSRMKHNSLLHSMSPRNRILNTIPAEKFFKIWFFRLNAALFFAHFIPFLLQPVPLLLTANTIVRMRALELHKRFNWSRSGSLVSTGLQLNTKLAFTLRAQDSHKITWLGILVRLGRLCGFFRLCGKIIAFGNQQRRIGIGQRPQFLADPDKMFLGAYNFTAFFTHLQFKLTSLAHCTSIEAGPSRIPPRARNCR